MTTAKEVSNSEITTPAYILQVSYPTDSSRNKSYTLRDPDLLAARQAALHKAQQIIIEKSMHDAIDITLLLVETNRVSISDKHSVIANVYKGRHNRTSFISSEGEDILSDMDRNSLVARSLPASLFLTIGLERKEEAGNSLEVVEKALTAEELAYYGQREYQPSILPLL